MASATGQVGSSFGSFTAGNSGTATRSQYFSSLLLKLPWTYNIIQNIARLNPKYETFHDIGQSIEDKARRQSVFQGFPAVTDDMPTAGGQMLINKDYHDFMYANVEDADKARRLSDYRRMASYAKVANCLDEICDELVVEDKEGEVCKLSVKSKIEDNVRAEIQKEWRTFSNRFNLPQTAWETFRHLMIDGEVFFENIISQNQPKLGIIGIVPIPPELINPIYDNISNMNVRGFVLKKPILSLKSQTEQKWSEELIPLDKHQVTYINSGIWNENRTIRIPMIENCRRAYKQLSLIEDTIIIHRLVHGTARFVFYVDTGNMPAPKAENYIQRLMHQFWAKKNYDSSQGRTTNISNPQSMLDSFWFPKQQGRDGTKVEMLNSTQTLGKLEDLDYFVKELYESMRVPSNRIKGDQATSTDENSIMREELRFAKFCIRIQKTYAKALRDSFITHLKFREMWEKFELKEADIITQFNLPSNFMILKEQQITNLNFNNFNTITQNGSISPLFAQRHYLNLNDKQIAENIAFSKKFAALKWELNQIEQGGPNWAKNQQQAAEQGAAGGTAMAGGGGGGGAIGGVGVDAGGSALPSGTPEEKIAGAGLAKSPEEVPPEIAATQAPGGGQAAPAGG